MLWRSISPEGLLDRHESGVARWRTNGEARLRPPREPLGCLW